MALTFAKRICVFVFLMNSDNDFQSWESYSLIKKKKNWKSVQIGCFANENDDISICTFIPIVRLKYWYHSGIHCEIFAIEHLSDRFRIIPAQLAIVFGADTTKCNASRRMTSNVSDGTGRSQMASHRFDVVIDNCRSNTSNSRWFTFSQRERNLHACINMTISPSPNFK